MAIKGNNPGNIRRVNGVPWLGEIQPQPWAPGFVTFSNLQYGFRALLKLLQTYITKHGADTVEKIISRWAPPSENNTENYIQFVCTFIKLNRYQKIYSTDTPTLSWIAAAIAEMEHSGQLTNVDYTALNAAAAALPNSPGAGAQTAGASDIGIILLLIGIVLYKLKA
jgi:hypothetical protein